MRSGLLLNICLLGAAILSYVDGRKCACAKHNANIRSRPAAGSTSRGLLKKGACLTFIKSKPGWGISWTKVEYNSEDGWIKTKALQIGACAPESEARQCACGTGNVNIRNGASTSNSILGVLKVESCLPYLGKEVLVGRTRWAQVDYGGQTGFVSARYLSIRSCGEVAAVNQCACAQSNVNIRAGASTANSILGTLKTGSCVPYAGDQIPVGKHLWAHVNYRGKEGFIASDYLTFGSCGGNSVAGQCVCGTTKVNIRAGASTSKDILGSLLSGACIPYKGNEAFAGGLRWANVDYNGKDAYVASKYIVFKSCEGFKGS